MRNDRRWGVAQAGLNHEFDVVGGEDFDGRGKSRFRQGVRVHAHKQWAGVGLCLPIFANRLADGEDVILGEGIFQRRTTVPRGAEGHLIGWLDDIGLISVVGRDQSRDIDKQFVRSRLAGQGVCRHRAAFSFASVFKSGGIGGGPVKVPSTPRAILAHNESCVIVRPLETSICLKS
jgi:hypothetical protein